jgi:CheY-like chemotaxis protein
MDDRDESAASPLAVGKDVLPIHPTGTILLVDDEAYIRELAETVLRQHGYRVVLAEGGPEGLERFRGDQPFDLVILDLTMPELTGWDVLRALIARDPHVRVLLSSGYSNEPTEASLPPQVRGFLPKPYRPADLIAHVRAILAAPN